MFEFASVIVLDNERSLDLREYCEVFIAYMVSKLYKWYMPTARGGKTTHIPIVIYLHFFQITKYPYAIWRIINIFVTPNLIAAS